MKSLFAPQSSNLNMAIKILSKYNEINGNNANYLTAD